MSTTQVNEPAASSQALDARAAATKSWRDAIKVHPAANLFPMMSDEELDALGADIKKNGLRLKILLWGPHDSDDIGDFQLLDGRNRIEAMLRAGIDFDLQKHGVIYCKSVDPYAYVISANIQRRHLTAEAKRELIAKLLKASPEKSDRQIAKTVGVNHETVAAVRKKKIAAGDVAESATRTDTKGRQQPAKKPKPAESYVEVDGKKLTLAEAAKALGGHGYTVMGRGGNNEDDELTVEDDLEPHEYREAFLLRAADAMAFAIYSGDVDQEVIEAAKRVVTKWQELIQTMEPDPIAASAEARKLEAAAAEALDRTVPA